MSTGQPASKHPVVLTIDSAAAANEDVVDSNVTVVNAMYAELLDAPEIAPNALRSYYVDFYLTQALAGGFAQYVFTVPEREEIDAYVREGLEGMGATAHLALFNRTAAAFDALSEDDADTYLDGDTEHFDDADGADGSTDDDAQHATTAAPTATAGAPLRRRPGLPRRSGNSRGSTTTSSRCWRPRTSLR